MFFKNRSGKVHFQEQIGELVLHQDWDENICRLTLTNPTGQSVKLNELEIYRQEMTYPPDTPCRGEGYNKLAQYAGTVAECKMSGSLGDQEHYRLPKPENCAQVYNYVLFMPDNELHLLMGFTSCQRFTGMFRFNSHELCIVVNGEGIELGPHETTELETFFVAYGAEHELLEQYGKQIRISHPALPVEEIPTGWCSWLVYGPDITEEDIYENLEEIKKKGLRLKYIQIDDGYQQYMGDWLYPTDKFESGMEKLCADIKASGFEPGIWVAPFIAEKDSRLFKEHPDWFVADVHGKPLSSDRVTFGGWSHGPWYMLDGTHPEACGYLKHVFQVMRRQWHVRYFKLDANMWGAMPFGKRYAQNKTSVEAYRMGMKAILEGAGEDSFILGCNAPMWPSLGLVHGMRITNDNNREYRVFHRMTRECFPRNWQNGTLWVNDPDTVVLENEKKSVSGPDGKEICSGTEVSRDEFLFNAAYIAASGGMVLSGDRIKALSEENLKIMKKLLPPVGKAARFDSVHEIGWAQISEQTRRLFLFNYKDTAKWYEVAIPGDAVVTDFWSGEKVAAGEFLRVELRPHSARIFDCNTL